MRFAAFRRQSGFHSCAVNPATPDFLPARCEEVLFPRGTGIARIRVPHFSAQRQTGAEALRCGGVSTKEETSSCFPTCCPCVTATENLFMGSFESFAAAEAGAPTSKAVGYSNAKAAGELYSHQIYFCDYPGLFWLGHCSTCRIGSRRSLRRSP